MAHSMQTGESSDSLNTTNAEHTKPHILAPLQCVLVYVGLLVLTGLTIGSSFLHLGIANPAIVITIACIKAFVVILFFMHVLFQSRLIKMTVTAGFFMLLVLISMTMSDYISRSWGMW